MPERGDKSARVALEDAAEELALTKGYPATTVDDICSAAGVTKGSFYHHFSSKDDLGRAVLDRYFARLMEEFSRGIAPSGAPSVDRLRSFLSHAERVAESPALARGCLIGSFALDLAETNPSVQNDLAGKCDRLAQVVAELIRAAAPAEYPDDGPSPEALGRQFVGALEGGIVLSKAYASPSHIGDAVRGFRSHVELLLQLDD